MKWSDRIGNVAAGLLWGCFIWHAVMIAQEWAEHRQRNKARCEGAALNNFGVFAPTCRYDLLDEEWRINEPPKNTPPAPRYAAPCVYDECATGPKLRV